jgi:hypothetical protein
VYVFFSLLIVISSDVILCADNFSHHVDEKLKIKILSRVKFKLVLNLSSPKFKCKIFWKIKKGGLNLTPFFIILNLP